MPSLSSTALHGPCPLSAGNRIPRRRYSTPSGERAYEPPICRARCIGPWIRTEHGRHKLSKSATFSSVMVTAFAFHNRVAHVLDDESSSPVIMALRSDGDAGRNGRTATALEDGSYISSIDRAWQSGAAVALPDRWSGRSSAPGPSEARNRKKIVGRRSTGRCRGVSLV